MDRDLTSPSSDVTRMIYALPDLAFDRDPARKQAYIKMDGDDDDDELGYAIPPSDNKEEPADSELYLKDDLSKKSEN